MEWLNSWLASPWLSLILLLGAFGDAFILTALFVFGELFFLATGYALATQQSLFILLAIWLGAVLGDVTSYLIGRRYGILWLYKSIQKRPKLRLNVRKARSLIQKRGVCTLVLARLLGPIAKITPFLAGSLKMPFGSFLLASLTGVLAGTAQFILAGWLLAKGINQDDLWSSIWQIIQQYPVGIGLGVMLVGVGVWWGKRG